VARLFGRGGPAQQSAVEAHLDGDAALVAQAEDPEAVRESLAAVWRLRLEGLLRQDPGVEEELRALVERVRQALPVPQQSWVQTNIARERATQNIVQHGTLHVHRGGGDPPGVTGVGSR
jgi:anti-sigma factor RsiW